MSGRKSKQKGNAFEREVATLLNSIYRTDEFRRTPQSGALMGQSNYARNARLEESTKLTLAGDIICPSWFPYIVEVKHHKNSPNYATMIRGSDVTLDHWLGEVLFDAKNAKLHPMLVFKTTRVSTYFAIPAYIIISSKYSKTIKHILLYDSFAVMGIDILLQDPQMLTAIGSTNLTRVSSFYKKPQIKHLLQLLESKKKPQIMLTAPK